MWNTLDVLLMEVLQYGQEYTHTHTPCLYDTWMKMPVKPQNSNCHESTHSTPRPPYGTNETKKDTKTNKPWWWTCTLPSWTRRRATSGRKLMFVKLAKMSRCHSQCNLKLLRIETPNGEPQARWWSSPPPTGAGSPRMRRAGLSWKASAASRPWVKDPVKKIIL